MILKEYVSQKLPFLQMSGKHVRPQGRRERQETLGGPDPMSPPEETLETPAVEPEAAQPDVPEPPAPDQPAGQADFEAGMQACRERDYAGAMEALLRAAEAGHREAQFLCGQLYQLHCGSGAQGRGGAGGGRTGEPQHHQAGGLVQGQL